MAGIIIDEMVEVDENAGKKRKYGISRRPEISPYEDTDNA